MVRKTAPLELELIPRVVFARELKVHPRTLDYWVRQGLNGVRLVATYIGVRVFFTREDWTAFQDALSAARSRPIGRTRLQARKDETAAEARWRAAGMKW